MQALGSTISLSIVALLIITPIFLYRLRLNVFVNFFLALIVSFFLVVSLSWFNDIFPDYRLSKMGFDISGISHEERIEEVPVELRQEATKLYNSRFGVGWPVKVIFGMFIVFPYNLFILLIYKIYQKWRKHLTSQ